MDIIFMDLILIFAFVVLGYYIADAFISLFRYQSDAVTRVRHKRTAYKVLSTLNKSKFKQRASKTLKRCVNQ